MSMSLSLSLSMNMSMSRSMSLYQIISICQRTFNILNCAQEGVTLFSKQVAVKKKMRICFNIKATATKYIRSIFKAMFEFILKKFA